MPLYEFVCEDCRKEFEELVKAGTETLPCPECGGAHVHRLMSACAFSVGGKTTTTASASSSGCSGCAGGSCSSCGH